MDDSSRTEKSLSSFPFETGTNVSLCTLLKQLIETLWRKRVGVEPTILAAKDRINGFEGHENHRIPFASATIIGMAMCAFNFSQECSALSCGLVREA